MLSKEQNELLTRVGKGTPMGDTMRRYWHPIAASYELPHPDCDPLRTRLLGETFVVFRDTQGRVGVMDELCTHRGASMALGRVEDGGIRCLYHGWKFAVDGTILDIPNHADPRMRERLKAPCYPVREQSGLIWTYIGPKELQPPFRRFAFDDVPDTNRTVIRLNVKANYLQMWEGGTDSSHVGILHSNLTRPGWLTNGGTKGAVHDMISDAWDDTAPKLEIEDTAFGFHYVGIRQLGKTAEAKRNVRLVPIFMPTGRIIPFPDFYATVFDTPQDDENTSTYLVDASETLPLDRDARLRRSGLTEEKFFDGRHFVADWSTGFHQDRVGMRERGNWSGFSGITQEDAVISLSMGRIYDRSLEHLVASDAAVARLRQRLLESVRLHGAGQAPLGLMHEDMSKMRSFDKDLPSGAPWRDEAADHGKYYRSSAG